ncbi:MAG: hypothetical protein R3E97_23720 [Candidatus Eisenbacteria bacterium]
MTYDLWNDGDGVDSVFVAWAESGDDSDQYFMYYSATPVLDDDWMNANLSGAIPLGNLNPYGTDSLIRIGFTVTPGVTQSTDGVGSTSATRCASSSPPRTSRGTWRGSRTTTAQPSSSVRSSLVRSRAA